MSEVVGEGTYGCVTKPSLACKRKQNYTNKVSKVMKTVDARKEKKEFKILEAIPGIDKYVIDGPVLCQPRLDETFYTTVSKCETKRVKETFNPNPSKLSLLLLENGGVNLNQFAKNIYPTISNQEKNIFLTSLLELFKGVAFFNKNNIIHQDIKSDNIVYNIKNGVAKFIDFGLTVKKDAFIKQSNENKNKLAQSWPYFPPEFSCTNRAAFNTLRKCKRYRDDYVGDYNAYIKDIADSFDSYCLTFALRKLFLQLARNFNREYNRFFYEVIDLMEKYSEEDLFLRNKDLVALHAGYLEILKKRSIYTTKSPSPSLENIDLAETLSVANTVNSNILRICPPSLPDFNPLTRKCVHKCKPEKTRNDKFRCVKTRRVRNSVTRSNKKAKCERQNKDMNPRTTRCVKKCKNTQKRNDKYKCVSR
jgi:serine/threonine protein kinase